MTITTEQLEARATALGLDFFIEDRAGTPVKQWFGDAQGCIPATRAEVTMWELLAAREAVPVGFIEQSGLDYLQSGADADIWPDGGVGDIPLYTAPPATAYPENLPCPVRLMPGLLFGKGVRTRILLDALARRAKYEAELEAMTPEQKAEHDAAGEWLKSMLPTPAPAVPGDASNE